jgi:hypothetical protein
MVPHVAVAAPHPTQKEPDSLQYRHSTIIALGPSPNHDLHPCYRPKTAKREELASIFAGEMVLSIANMGLQLTILEIRNRKKLEWTNILSLYVYIYIYARVCTYTYMSIHVHNMYIYIHMYVYLVISCTCMYVYVNI